MKAWEESPGQNVVEKLPSEADQRPLELPPTTVPESLVIPVGSEPPRAGYGNGKVVAGSIALLALLTVGFVGKMASHARHQGSGIAGD